MSKVSLSPPPHAIKGGSASDGDWYRVETGACVIKDCLFAIAQLDGDAEFAVEALLDAIGANADELLKIAHAQQTKKAVA